MAASINGAFRMAKKKATYTLFSFKEFINLNQEIASICLAMFSIFKSDKKELGNYF